MMMTLIVSLVCVALGTALVALGTTLLRRTAGNAPLSPWAFPEGTPVPVLLCTIGGVVLGGIGAMMIQDFGRRPAWLSVALIAVLALVWGGQILLHNRGVARRERG